MVRHTPNERKTLVGETAGARKEEGGTRRKERESKEEDSQEKGPEKGETSRDRAQELAKKRSSLREGLQVLQELKEDAKPMRRCEEKRK